MGSEWTESNLESCATILSGGTPRKSVEDYWGGNIPWVSAKDMKVMRLAEAQDTLTELGAENGTRLVRKGTTLLLVRGMTLHNDVPICLVERELAFNQDVKAIQAKEVMDDHFLFYWLRAQKPRLLSLVDSAGHGTGRLNTDQLKVLPVLLPPLETQITIASMLSSLDDKIELNREMNRTLEKIAQTIFKSWFIDFDPVVRNAVQSGNPVPARFAEAAARYRDNPDALGLPQDVLKLFPDRFVESELGEIPEGWEIESLDQIADFMNGLACQKYPPVEGEDDLPVIKIRELRQGMSEKTDRASADVPKKYIIRNGDILFSWSGSLMVKMWSEGTGVLNQHLFKVTSPRFPKWFYHHWTSFHLAEFSRIAADKATTMGHIKRHHLSDAKVVIPTNEVMSFASAQLEPMLSMELEFELNSFRLAKLRDALLPKLISGELPIPQSLEVEEGIA